jgi:transcriptional regulator with XRE-family HTH domain
MAGTENPSPAVQRRRLRTELRRARQKAGLTQDQVSTALEMSLSKIIRVEAGTVGISANDLRALLGLYHVDDPTEVDNLLTLARAGRERPWQSAYRDVVSPQLLQFIDFEAAALIIRNFQPLMIPGLLQTEEYARLMLGQLTADLSDHRIELLVEVRKRRQELLDRDDAPMLFFILDEAAAHRLVGGRDTMRRQLIRLIEAAAMPHITVEVVPFSSGPHPGLNGPFVIHEFPDTADDDVLYQERPQAEQIWRDEPELIAHYRETFEELRRLSLGPEGTLAFLNELADGLALPAAALTEGGRWCR